MKFATALLLCTLSIGTIGCSTTYYQVRDPNSGATYYTTKIDNEAGGAVSLKDHRTNAQVTIQNSEVMEMTPDQYDAAIRTIVVPAGVASEGEPTRE
jgi:hypothetical protein